MEETVIRYLFSQTMGPIPPDGPAGPETCQEAAGTIRLKITSGTPEKIRGTLKFRSGFRRGDGEHGRTLLGQQASVFPRFYQKQWKQ